MSDQRFELSSPTCGLMLLRKNVAHMESWDDRWLAAAARCPLSYPLFLKIATNKVGLSLVMGLVGHQPGLYLRHETSKSIDAPIPLSGAK